MEVVVRAKYSQLTEKSWYQTVVTKHELQHGMPEWRKGKSSLKLQLAFCPYHMIPFRH